MFGLIALGQAWSSVETVIQTRFLLSRQTKLTLPIGSPSTVSNITVVSPVRVIRSRQSVPKFEIRISPLSAKARPLGSVPSTNRSEEHTSELQSLMRRSYAVYCLNKKILRPHPSSS